MPCAQSTPWNKSPDSKARRAIDCGSLSLLPGFIPSRSVSFYIFVKPSVTCAACPWFILARHKPHKPQSRGSVTLYMVCLLAVRVTPYTNHKQNRSSVTTHTHFLCYLASYKTGLLPSVGFLAHWLTTSKSPAQTNKQALMWLYRLVPIQDTKASLVDW